MPWGIAAAGAISGLMGGAGQSAASSAMADVAREQLDWTKKVYGQAQKDIKPYTHLGEVGATGYEANLPYLTSRYGMEDYKQSPLYTPMVRNLAELQATPGYQFQLQQGLQGVQQSAAAKGGLLSGAAGQAMNNYAQGQAAQGYQSAWERAQKAYGTAFNQDLSQKAQIGTMYLEPAKLGSTSALGLGQIGVGAANAMAPAYQALGAANAAGAAAPWTGAASAVGSLGSLFGGGGIGSSGGIGSYPGGSPSSQVSWGYQPGLGG
jgi:hypothetical protein